MTIYAVGDIQGCFDALQCLLADVSFLPEKDELWCAGDLVNRGPKSLETLRFIKQLGPHAKVVLGNHDLHLLAAYYTNKPLKAKDNMQAVLDAPDCAELMHWLKSQPLMLRENGYTMMHAGICPSWSIEQAEQLADEIHDALSGNNYLDYFHNMYGNMPNIWHDDLQGSDRLRVITNYFTRLRFCKSDGELTLSEKQAPDYYDEDFAYSPWFEYLHPSWSNETLLFGHWASLQGECDKDNIFALDTGCVWGGKLSMLRLGDNQLFQCSCHDVEASY
jgi:bis(5'-nucleosyl)-tetraphosphatase (symmetrical)